MVSLKLMYYDRKGLAETSRLVLLIAGFPFGDARLSPEELKSVQEGAKAIASQEPPYLEMSRSDGGKEYICCHWSIERFLAKKCGMMGRSLAEEVKIDSVCEMIRGIQEEYERLGHYQKIKPDKDTTSYFSERFKARLESLVQAMDTASVSYSVGNKISLADVMIYTMVTSGLGAGHSQSHALEIAGSIKKIRNILTKVSSIQAVRDWTEKHPL